MGSSTWAFVYDDAQQLPAEVARTAVRDYFAHEHGCNRLLSADCSPDNRMQLLAVLRRETILSHAQYERLVDDKEALHDASMFGLELSRLLGQCAAHEVVTAIFVAVQKGVYKRACIRAWENRVKQTVQAYREGKEREARIDQATEGAGDGDAGVDEEARIDRATDRAGDGDAGVDEEALEARAEAAEDECSQLIDRMAELRCAAGGKALRQVDLVECLTRQQRSIRDLTRIVHRLVDGRRGAEKLVHAMADQMTDVLTDHVTVSYRICEANERTRKLGDSVTTMEEKATHLREDVDAGLDALRSDLCTLRDRVRNVEEESEYLHNAIIRRPPRRPYIVHAFVRGMQCEVSDLRRNKANTEELIDVFNRVARLENKMDERIGCGIASHAVATRFLATAAADVFMPLGDEEFMARLNSLFTPVILGDLLQDGLITHDDHREIVAQASPIERTKSFVRAVRSAIIDERFGVDHARCVLVAAAARGRYTRLTEFFRGLRDVCRDA